MSDAERVIELLKQIASLKEDRKATSGEIKKLQAEVDKLVAK